MAAVINTNYLSLVAQNNLNKSQSSLGTAIERLSSGLRINSAKDDAAGMAIANRFTANVKGLTQAARNANDGISLAQTTEGAASEVNTHLQRIRELTVQASNGSYSQEQLDSVQGEINQRLADIDRISEQTDFNGVKVLSDSAKPLTLQVGANDGETITLNLSEISVKTLGLDGFNVNGKGVVQNRAANVNDLTGPNVAAVAGQPNQYDVTTKNTSATAADVLGKLTDGNKVVVQGAAADTTYTFDAASGNFTYDKVDTAATVATAITSKIGSTPATATFKNDTQEVSIQIASDGKISDANGNALYYDGAGNLSATDDGGNYAQATVTDLTTFMGTAATPAGVELSVNGTTYKSQAAATANIVYETTATTAEVISAIDGLAAGKTATITMGSGVLSASVTVDDAGLVEQGALELYVDDKNELTTTAKVVQRFEFDQISGKVEAIAGGDTYTSAGVTGVDPNADSLGKQLFVDSSGKMTFDTTSAGDKTTDPLKTLDAAFTKLDKLTGELGAVQNRLESTIANLNNVVNNLSSARSRIQDADYATEVSNMSKAQILQQAGTSVLAQANQVPQTVLSLLR